MTFDLNFFIIIFILILVMLYFDSSSNVQANEHFADQKCSDIKQISIDSEQNNSTYCPVGCKASLTEDRKNIYCVDNK